MQIKFLRQVKISVGVGIIKKNNKPLLVFQKLPKENFNNNFMNLKIFFS